MGACSSALLCPADARLDYQDSAQATHAYHGGTRRQRACLWHGVMHRGAAAAPPRHRRRGCTAAGMYCMQPLPPGAQELMRSKCLHALDITSRQPATRHYSRQTSLQSSGVGWGGGLLPSDWLLPSTHDEASWPLDSPFFPVGRLAPNDQPWPNLPSAPPGRLRWMRPRVDARPSSLIAPRSPPVGQ